jgi:hypothetical protein
MESLRFIIQSYNASRNSLVGTATGNGLYGRGIWLDSRRARYFTPLTAARQAPSHKWGFLLVVKTHSSLSSANVQNCGAIPSLHPRVLKAYLIN